MELITELKLKEDEMEYSLFKCINENCENKAFYYIKETHTLVCPGCMTNGTIESLDQL